MTGVVVAVAFAVLGAFAAGYVTGAAALRWSVSRRPGQERPDNL